MEVASFGAQRESQCLSRLLRRYNKHIFATFLILFHASVAPFFLRMKRSGDGSASAGKKSKQSGGLDAYELGDVLGSGAFATVNRATRKSDGVDFAVKVSTMC